MLKIFDLEIEYRNNPLGIDEKIPAFSWKIDSDKKNVKQKSYQIKVFREDETVWDSGLINDENSLYIEYRGEDLLPQTKYEITLKITDNTGDTASSKAFFETGLMGYEGFAAEWITHPFKDEDGCIDFIKNYKSEKRIEKARAYLSALGIYSLTINGSRVSDTYFAPGWTAYQKRIQYQTYDITEYLRSDNEIKITVGNGWYKGILGFYGQGNHYGDTTATIALFDIWYEDGSKCTITTDESWFCKPSVHRYNEIYNGEIIDLTYSPKEVEKAIILKHPKEILVSQENEPVKITERVSAKKLIISPKGEKIIDFGQNMSGIVELKIKKPRGTTITLRHAEALDEKGNLFTTNLRTAKATDVFVTSGDSDIFLPEFTFHGFRYVSVEGIDDIEIKDFTACVMHSDIKSSTMFKSNNEAINKLWSNIDWTMRSNYFDIPMDCPQRDERLGYTGDCEIFLPTACDLRNVALFFRKWLRDLRVEQGENGAVYLTVPDIIKTYTCVQVWHEAATIVPWLIWQNYADKRVLKEQYDSMLKSVEYTKHCAGEAGLLTAENSSQFGDWLALDYPKGACKKPHEGTFDPSNDEKGGGTDKWFLANVYYLYSIDIVKRTAEILGKKADLAKYENLYDDVKRKIKSEYITSGGRLVGETQTALSLALYYGLIDSKHITKLRDALELNLIKNKKHLNTGFVGTQYIMKALSNNGLHKLAGDLLFKEDCPSWLYEIKHGATTIWELWDGVKEDGSFNAFEMNSLNQYGFASVGDWIFSEVCGLKVLEAGYRHFSLKPRPVEGLHEFKLEHECVYGRIVCDFSCNNGLIKAYVKIPVGTTALLSLPNKESERLGSGEYFYEYETDLSYERKKFNEDCLLNDLRAYTVAEKIFMEEAPDLASSGFVRGFAGNMSIIEIKKTLPENMIPKSAFATFEKMINVLNGGTDGEL